MKNKIILAAGLVVIVGLVLYGVSSDWFNFLSVSESDEAGERVVGEEQPPLPEIVGPLPEIVGIFYTTSVDKAPYGNFTFQYPSALLLDKNELEKDSSGKEYHFVVLKDRFGIDPGATVEINAPDATCENYEKCQEIDGIVIGTDSTNAEFIKMFDEIAANFEVFEPPQLPQFPPIEVEPQ